jgi:hypothetical protein
MEHQRLRGHLAAAGEAVDITLENQVPQEALEAEEAADLLPQVQLLLGQQIPAEAEEGRTMALEHVAALPEVLV